MPGIKQPCLQPPLMNACFRIYFHYVSFSDAILTRFDMFNSSKHALFRVLIFITFFALDVSTIISIMWTCH